MKLSNRKPADVESSGSGGLGDVVAAHLAPPLDNHVYVNENPPEYEEVVSADQGKNSYFT